MPWRDPWQCGPNLPGVDSCGSLLENTISRKCDGRKGVEVMEGECCILCSELCPTAVCAQRGQSPVPQCQWELMSLGQTNTSVSRPQSPHQSDHSARRCSVITHHRLLWGGAGLPDWGADPITAVSITTGMCWKNRESERDRESEWEGRWGKDSPVWDREAGGEARDPPPSCERLEAVCASTSGRVGRAERTDVRIGRSRNEED